MERNVQRINGERARLHRFSNEELIDSLAYAYMRLERAQQDIDKLHFEQSRRTLGAVALQDELDFSGFDDGFSVDGAEQE